MYKRQEQLKERIQGAVEKRYAEKDARLGTDLMRAFEKDVLLRVVDQSWKDHLLALDHLKEGIGLRGYGQRDPKNEYKRESFELLQAMKERVEDTVVKTLFRVEPVSVEQLAQQRRVRPLQPASSRLEPSGPAKAAGPPRPVAVVRAGEKIGRNDPCPCGSGKKYKKCHGRTQAVS